MSYLLDTHVWLWMLAEPERLSPRVRRLVENGSTPLALSAVSVWEIAIKYSIGRLPLPEPPGEFVPPRLRTTGVAPLNITAAHALRVADLPPAHSDPFDRILVAQAQAEKLTLITADPAFGAYDLRVLDAV